MDRATRYGSCIPVTTIGIAPTRTRGRQIRRFACNCSGSVIGASLRPMLADVPQMSRFENIKMLLWRFVDKMDGQ